MQGGGDDLEAAGVGDVDAAASGGFCIGTGETDAIIVDMSAMSACGNGY
jgi:hypothetical protein